jgi:hypothetical protein
MEGEDCEVEPRVIFPVIDVKHLTRMMGYMPQWG